MPHIAETLIRQRRWVVLGWALVTAALVPGALRIERTLEAAAHVPGSESESVEHDLASRFGSPYAQFAVLVVSDVSAESRRQLVDSLAKRVSRVEGVTRVRAWRDSGDTLFVADSGRTTFLLAGIDATRYAPGDVVDGLRAATRGFTGPTLRWTGEAALNADMRQVSARDAAAAEHRVMPLAAVLLVVAFGTLVAALLPLVTGALTIVVALGAAALIATHWPLSIVLQTFVTMIGLGLGIDYALLVVSRFRELLAAGATPVEAAAEAARRAGHTIILSGASVGIGFCGLLAAPVSDLRSLAVGGVLVVSAAVLVATTLLPALLAGIGSRVNAGRLWPNRITSDTGGGWRRWGEWVVRRPGLALLAGAIPLVALAWPARRMVAGTPQGTSWLPPTLEAVAGWHELERVNRGSMLQVIRVVVDLPAQHDLGTAAGWAALRKLRARLAEDPRVALVLAPTSRLTFATLPDSARRMVVTADRRSVLVEVVPQPALRAEQAIELARDLRRLDVASVTGVPGVKARVGGLPALRADYLDTVRHGFPLAVALIVSATLIALAIGFRSILIPVKAVALNLLSVAAGFGAVVLVFQDGVGAALLGVTRLDQVFATVPTLVFCTVFGLSMDYEVFLVSRVAEARRAGLAERAAIVEGLARTGRVITSAALIMVAVFGAFIAADFVLIKMLGLALTIAVLADATLVRIVIGPALLALAGRWNWWPGDVR
jgi:RND superfamily putative drug exporter